VPSGSSSIAAGVEVCRQARARRELRDRRREQVEFECWSRSWLPELMDQPRVAQRTVAGADLTSPWRSTRLSRLWRACCGKSLRESLTVHSTVARKS
jgi:hypothetical protein